MCKFINMALAALDLRKMTVKTAKQINLIADQWLTTLCLRKNRRELTEKITMDYLHQQMEAEALWEKTS